MKRCRKLYLPTVFLLVAWMLAGTGLAADTAGPVADGEKPPQTAAALPIERPAGVEADTGQAEPATAAVAPAFPPEPPGEAVGEDPASQGPPVGVPGSDRRPDDSPVPPSESLGSHEALQSENSPTETGMAAEPSGAAPLSESGSERPTDSDTAEAMAPAVVSGEKGAGSAEPVAIEPSFVRSLNDILAGHNDSNPVWSPSGKMLAFERSIGDKREIIVARQDGSIVQKIYCRATDDEGDMDFFFPEIVDEVSYNAGISWSPDEDRLVFMSNGGSGNYDLYLAPSLGEERTIRLTEHIQKDSHPHWCPAGDRLVFVSGRTGKAEIYLMELPSRKLSMLTNGEKTYLYPQWSPDGRQVLMMYGSNENHDIYIVEDIANPAKSLKALTTWQYDDLRPVWSPDGKKVAFYSNANPQNNPKEWSIIVMAADGSDPNGGEALAAKVVARNVIPDIERGPAWMPDSLRIVYVKNDEQAYNPIYVTRGDGRSSLPIKTHTKMNHDVVCSKDGTLAFRAQTEQWDHIYIARLTDE